MPHEHIYRHRVQNGAQRVGEVLRHELGMSRQVLIRLKRSGTVLLNGSSVYLNVMAAPGDELVITLREEKQSSLIPEDISLDIAYEDEFIVVVDKPAGLVVHPTKGYMSGTLAHALAYRWREQEVEHVFRPVHRLDRDTSGLVVIAKNPHVQAVLTAAQHSGSWTKHYIAVVNGSVGGGHGIIEAPIARLGNGSRARIISPDGSPAITHWWELARKSSATVVRARLITGRTHQIRVHFAHIGHPLLGDEVYGKPHPLIARQALHAAHIAFVHPVTHARIELESPLPNDLQALLSSL